MNHRFIARFLFAMVMPVFLAVYGAVPAAINYQGIARKADGTPIGNQLIKIRASVHQATATGTIVYQESQSATTTPGGQFSIKIGKGTPMVNTFAAVVWPASDNFLQIEIDPTGGSAFVDMGTQQFVSVPYALQAASADSTSAVVGSPFKVPIFSSTGLSLINSVITQSGGGIGINNSSPSYHLDLTGSARVTDIFVTGSDVYPGRDVNATRDLNAGGVVTVENGKGIVRSSSSTQLKLVRNTVGFSITNLASNGYVDSGELDYENFGGVPTVTMGACTVQNGEWYKVMIIPINVTASQCQFRIFNFASDAVTFSNANWQVLVVGPE